MNRLVLLHLMGFAICLGGMMVCSIKGDNTGISICLAITLMNGLLALINFNNKTGD